MFDFLNIKNDILKKYNNFFFTIKINFYEYEIFSLDDIDLTLNKKGVSDRIYFCFKPHDPNKDILLMSIELGIKATAKSKNKIMRLYNTSYVDTTYGQITFSKNSSIKMVEIIKEVFEKIPTSEISQSTLSCISLMQPNNINNLIMI